MYTSVQSIKDYLQAAEQQGVSTTELLKELGLSAEALSDGQATIHADVLVKLLQTVIPLSGNPLFGLTQATNIQANSFQILGYLALNSSNIKETMELVIEYEEASGTIGKTFIEEHGTEVFIGWECFISEPLVARNVVENVLASWRLYSKNFVNLDEAPQRVWFTHAAPANLSEIDTYNKIFEAQVHFGQTKNGIWITREQWLRPLPQANQAMLSVLEEHAAAHVKKLSMQCRDDKPTSDKVGRLLRLMLPHTVPQKRQIARQLGVSERTLQRMLAKEGTQYQVLLAHERLAIAKEFLGDPSCGTEYIAQQTGFSEVRSFYRFIKQMTGKTAMQLREEK